MKNSGILALKSLVTALLLFGLHGCKDQAITSETKEIALHAATNTEEPETPKRQLSEAFKKYWYAGDAEITSYKLEQERYGELRDGTAVLIFVTEPFLPNIQVKADGKNPDNVPVLKLNATKNYLTGIYPYSIMSSTFYPVYDNQHALKSSLSIQEWCGHVYSQLNNRDTFEFTQHSYFEGEADQEYPIEKALLENEIWNKIRIHPKGLPTGTIKIIPSLEYFRVKHTTVQAMDATATLEETKDMSTYTVSYNNDSRKLTINFSTTFPHTIESWSEEYSSRNRKMVSKGTKMKSLKTPYWGQNSNAYLHLRDSLNL